jgi:hypothetical protein
MAMSLTIDWKKSVICMNNIQIKLKHVVEEAFYVRCLN